MGHRLPLGRLEDFVTLVAYHYERMVSCGNPLWAHPLDFHEFARQVRLRDPGTYGAFVAKSELFLEAFKVVRQAFDALDHDDLHESFHTAVAKALVDGG